MRFAVFTSLRKAAAGLLEDGDWYVNLAQVVCVMVVKRGTAIYPKWAGEGVAPDQVYAIRFTSGDDLLVLEDPWGETQA